MDNREKVRMDRKKEKEDVESVFKRKGQRMREKRKRCERSLFDRVRERIFT